MRTRRDVLFGAAAAAGLAAWPASAASRIDVIARLRRVHRLRVGTLAGAFVVAPAGMVNWYFADLALAAILPDLDRAGRDDLIYPHLELHLARLDAHATIADVDFSGGDPRGAVRLVRPDSHDSYASVHLSLAAGLLASADGRDWLAARRDRLVTIAEANLLSQQKPNGLIRVFQQRSGLSDAGWFMDNCEDLAGLDAAIRIFDRFGATAAADRARRVATRLVAGLRALFDAKAGRFRAVDDGSPVGTAFYPDATCQIFPQALGLAELGDRFDAGWRALSALAPTWADCRLDAYPWAILGRVAALRGLRAPALRQMAAIEALLPRDPGRVPIHDLGFYHLTRRRLGV